MSQNVMRKAQPFTIGTRLSLPKCPDFSTPGPGLAPLDSSFLPLTLNERVSQYLAQTRPSSISPPRRKAALTSSPGEDGKSHTSSSRSIRKITLSSWRGEAQSHHVVRVNPRVLARNCQGNFNNNNSRPLRDTASKIHGSFHSQNVGDLVLRPCGSPCGLHVRGSSPGPRGSPCGLHVRGSSPGHRGSPCGLHVRGSSPGHRGSPCGLHVRGSSPGPRGSPCIHGVGRISRSPCTPTVRGSMTRICGPLLDQSLSDASGSVLGPSHDQALRDGVIRTSGPESHVTVTDQIDHSPLRERRAVSGDDVTAGRRTSVGSGITQFAKLSHDIKQTETWIQEKLKRLKNPDDACPLQELESQDIEADIRGLEGTIMKLSQVGEQVSRGHSLSATSLRGQLHSLTDQWQLLKQTAANQSRAMGGVRTLQEFNKKADELEIWMREKEVKPSLPLLLDENLDKVQLTRQILDLKQEQLHYRNLQENINNLAQKLEKEGRAESKGASNRRKQLNKMWLRLQDTLLEHQQSLQLALEASSLWQQADAILKALEEKKTCAAKRNEGTNEGRGDQEMRDIASKIMILDVAVSRVSSLHPMLSLRAGHKQRQVKESWSRLQAALRTERSAGPVSSATIAREAGGLPTPRAEEQSSVGNRAQHRAGIPQSRAEPRSCTEAGHLIQSPVGSGSRRDVLTECPADSTGKHNPGVGQRARTPCGSCDERLGLETLQVTDLMNELTSTEQWLHALEVHLSEPAALRSPEVIRRNLREVSILEKEVKSRGLALHTLGARVWELGITEWELSENTLEKVQEVKERVQMVQDSLRQRTSDLRDTLVLSEFMKVVQLEEEKRSRKMSGSGGAIREGLCDPGMEGDPRNVFTPLEELQEAVEILNDAAKERERTMVLTREKGNLQSRLSVLSQMICTAQEWLDEITRQSQDAERSFAAVKCQEDLKDVQELFVQHQDLEYNVSGPILLEVTRLEDQLDRLRALAPDKKHMADVGQTLQAWTRLQEKVRENKECLERTDRLRRFFLTYLEIISWTEDTRAQIFTEGVVASRDEELDRSIEVKLKEFEELATIGWKFVGEDHFLTPTIKERMEELQGMLSWVLMRWRSQKKQRIAGSRAENHRLKEIPHASHGLRGPQDPNDGTTICISPEATGRRPGVSACQGTTPAKGHQLRRYERRTHSPLSLENHLSLVSMASEVDIPPQAELKGGILGVTRSEGPVWLEPKEIPTETEKMETADTCYMPPHPKSGGPNTFWRRCQGLLQNTFGSLKRKKRVSLPVMDEVSTYLHVKTRELPAHDSCQSLTVLRPQNASPPSLSPKPCISSTGASSVTPTKTRPCLLFSSLKRKEKPSKCTDRGVPGLYEEEKSCHTEDACHTHTWPPKQSKKGLATGPCPDQWKPNDHEMTPQTEDINAECGISRSEEDEHECETRNGGRSPRTAHQNLEIAQEGQVLGKAVLGAEESDPSDDLLDSILQEGTCEKSRHEMSPNPQNNLARKSHLSLANTSWIEALSQSSGYCRQNLHGYAKSRGSQAALRLEGSAEVQRDFELDRVCALHKPSEPQFDGPDLVPNPTQSHGISSLTSTGPCGRSAVTEGHPPVFMETIDSIYSNTRQHQDISAVRDLNTKIFPSKDCTQVCKTILTSKTQSHSVLSDPTANHGFYESPSQALPDVLHPDQEFLEQDDEELEGIWNNAKGSQVGCPSYPPVVMQDRRAEGGDSGKTLEGDLCKQPSGKVVMMTQPSMLVATFTLPTSALGCKELEQKRVTSEQESPGQGNIHVDLHQQELLGNRSEGDSSGNVLQVPLETKKKRETDDVKVHRRLDFQLMEGSLERKHTLQPGGRKASNRTWSVYYAVLVRRTLCFYHDRKHSTKSSVSASSLHLTGAVCTPDTNYIKRNNCFCLRLSDGSEYLLRASSSSLVQEWVSKLQHNSGLEETDLLSDPMLGSNLSPRRQPRASPLRSWIPDVCQPIPLPGSVIPEIPRDQARHLQNSGRNPPPSAISQLLYWFPDGSTKASDGSSSNVDDIANRRRSQSFSSVSYQRMTTTTSPQKTSPSYSVTLYIGDSPVPRGRCHSFATSPAQHEWSRDTGITKPRNLSVFKKLFRKKE